MALDGKKSNFSGRRLSHCRGNTGTEFDPLVASSGDITVTTNTIGTTCWIGDGGLCGMPREWIAELAGEPATFPTYRKRSARLTGQTTQVDLRLQLLLLQIPRVLIVEPKSIQASVRTQVDLVLQLVQVFVV